VNHFYALPVAFNTTAFSMLIIYAGSFKSAWEQVKTLKAIYVDKKKDASDIEVLSAKDSYMFTVQAGATLVGLYALIKYFGKDVVNKLILGYMGVAGAEAVKQVFLMGSPAANIDKQKFTLFEHKFFGGKV
jgi:hypothetical protein